MIVKFRFRFVSKSDRSIYAVQSAHTVPTPRVGGVVIILACTLIGTIFKIVPITLILGLLPILLIGICEDYKKEVKPRYRLLIASFSAVYCVIYYCGPISQIDFLPLKGILAFYPIAVAVTAFSIVGMINAINIIDGLNGFSGFQSVIMLSAIASLGYKLGDIVILSICLTLISGIFGFLLLNFPKGYIFMGDAGAYSIGFLIAALAIKLHNENPDISSWAILLILLWPVSDVLMSMYRRFRRKVDTKKPDFRHFHHIVMRSIEVFKGQKIDRSKSNPLATLILAPVSCLPAVTGTLAYSNSTVCFWAVLFFALLFGASYSATIRYMVKNMATGK